ncbi:hypothetical protein V1264_020343 [Littorina saxatilis]|uniref:C-type lectin domain-containing protein n=1 Tax=Littorina saxatilis TaxID=31220 RepID=A0AAN9BB50_9CAEN
MFVEKKTYVTAGDRCAQDGAHLYHFSSLVADKRVISQFLQASGLDRSWVGADDLAVHGSYVWSEGTPLPNGSPLWDPGEPSFTDNTGQKERCVGVYDRLTLNDFPCHSLMSFICQIDV